MIYIILAIAVLFILVAAFSLEEKHEEPVDIIDENTINEVNTIEAIIVKGEQYEVHTGPNGGSYYYKNGKRYYLTPKQKEKVYEL